MESPILRWRTGIPTRSRFTSTIRPLLGRHSYRLPLGARGERDPEVRRERNWLRWRDSALGGTAIDPTSAVFGLPANLIQAVCTLFIALPGTSHRDLYDARWFGPWR